MKLFQKIRSFEFMLAIVVLGVHLYVALSDAYNLPNAWFIRDDAYYYFKVAQNITEGKGSTFDGINPTNGYHPLWMLVCIPVFYFARFDLILPLRIMVMIMAGLNAATSILIFRIIRENLSTSVGVAAACFWSFNFHIHYIIYEFGLESPLAAFAVILFIYKLSSLGSKRAGNPSIKHQIQWLALIATMMMFSRLDLVFLALLAGIWIIFRGNPIRNLLPMDMVVFFFSMTASVALRTDVRTYNSLYTASTLEVVIIALIIKMVLLYLFGAYQHPGAFRLRIMAGRLLMALSASSLLMMGAQYLLTSILGETSFPRSAFAIDWGLSLGLTFGLRAAYSWMTRHSQLRIPPSPRHEFQQFWKRWFQDGLMYYGILGGFLSAYLLVNKIAFNTFLPVSSQIKRWWGALGNTVYDYPASNWSEFLGIGYDGVYAVWRPLVNLLLWIARAIKPLYPGSDTEDERYFIVLGMVVLALILVFLIYSNRLKTTMNKTVLIPLISGCGFHILSYTTTSYGGAKEWYWISQMVLIVLAGSVILDALLHPIQEYRGVGITLQVCGFLLGGYFLLAFGSSLSTAIRYNYFPADRPYMEVLPFLEENTPHNAVIGMTGGGNVGYFIHDRTIVNMDGLINSVDYFKSIQDGTGPVFLKRHGVQIVFANPRLLELPPYYGQFAPYLQSFSSYGGKDLLYLLEQPKY